MYCLKSELPKTEIVTFKRRSKATTIKWNNAVFESKNNNKNNINGYRVPCKGDSGSGQVVLTSITRGSKKVDKYVLAAVHTTAPADTFTQNGVEEYHVPCGTYTKDDTTNRFLMSASAAQSTSWPDIFNWIKDKAKIKQVSE